MSLCVLGWAEEFRAAGIAANALWPRTLIDTAAMAVLGGAVLGGAVLGGAVLGGAVRPGNCRRPEIVADAAHAIPTRPARACTGNVFVDEEVLRQEGVADLDPYAVDPEQRLTTDLFVPGYGEKA